MLFDLAIYGVNNIKFYVIPCNYIANNIYSFLF